MGNFVRKYFNSCAAYSIIFFKVIELKSELFEKTQELCKCQAELAQYQRPQSCILKLEE